MLEKFDFAGN